MLSSWIGKKRKKITQGVLALMVAGMLAAISACRAVPDLPPGAPLLPVDAPLFPAPPGTRFAPPDVAAAPIPTGDLPPASTGTHITASLLRANGSRLAAVWGDPILWEQTGKRWRPAPRLPRTTGNTAEVIALREDKTTKEITIGTRREGSFIARNGGWKPLPRPNLPRDANAQALAAYRGSLYVATLNDGLVVRNEKGIWDHIGPPTLSSDAPRQFLIWRDALYVRYGSGMVDRFDGRTWTRDVFTNLLPRRQVSAMAAHEGMLFLAQWGGWSETRSGTLFGQHFPPDLKNLPITALLPVGDRVYVGTQGRGLAEFDRATGSFRRWHDERRGIADDWITALARTDSGTIVAGTFVSGAFRSAINSAAPWQPLSGTETDCVTGAAVAGDTLLVSLRRGGIRTLAPGGETASVSVLPEAQCLLPDTQNRLLWIGTRTGIIAARYGAAP